ncbi:hypothetical protein [Nonlabens antarcticus]|uniref:hypothetical protein n=1 Tax=Nonlabens antarcticus TaxID=392714 RepID=UPI0018918F61|nr:hypothetical protein [Nonlabens antarcticus]
MKTKKILIGTLTLLVLAFIAFTQISATKKNNKTAITSFEIKGDSKEELKNFDWKAIEEMFKENDPEQNISIAAILLNGSDRQDDLRFELTGKTEDIDILTGKIKILIENLN